MKFFKIILKNAFRHKLRTLLTMTGIAIAIIAFGLLRTVLTSWDAQVEVASLNRLITRQAVSFIFPLPYAYKSKIEAVEGVGTVTFSAWFQGVYKDKDHFFPRLAIDPETYFDVYPEFQLTPEEFETFKKERNSCVIGKDIANQYNIKLGDIMSIEGDIYPGQWDFVVRGIYQPRDKSTDGTGMVFHWNYINERVKEQFPDRAGYVGWYTVALKDPDRAAEVSEKIDNLFKNSPAETKTETERAFSQNFMAAFSAILTAMDVMSFVIVGIIMLVVANTMIMSARERTKEYSVLKTIGFSAKQLSLLIIGESVLIAFLGCVIGVVMLFPVVGGFEQSIPKNVFPVFYLAPRTVVISVIAVMLVGVAASIFPLMKALKTSIVDGFRYSG